MNAARVIARCRELATITDVAGETTRTFLSDAMRRCNDLVAAWMREAELTVSCDAAGNLGGLRGDGSRRVIIASHLDTVPNAGAFDGPLGVTMGIEVAEFFRDTPLPFSLEVIGFSEEEGVRFSAPFIGSRALVGTLDDALLNRTDEAGTTVRHAIETYGLDCNALRSAKVQDALAYFEVHIEQGPVLEAEDRSLGVVSAIAGQSRYVLTFTGKANHAGTTPMHLRQDAMCAAAEWITRVEEVATSTKGLVATVGRIDTVPGAGNVIAGEVRATLDVRSADDLLRRDAVDGLLRVARDCGARREVGVRDELRMDQAAVAMDATLTKLLSEAAGPDASTMVSGAGHDAMVVAPHIPSAMLFVRSPGGLSHHPDETVRERDVAAALEVSARFMKLLAAKESNA